MRTMLRFAAGAIGIAAILVGAPVLLWLVARQILPASWPSPAEVSAVLRRPDDGSLLVGLLLVVGALVWVQLAASVVAELAAAVRQRPGVRVELPGLRGSRIIAAFLVAALLGTGAGTASAAPVAPPIAVVAHQEPLTVSASTSARLYIVQSRDTLWRIAETVLGDPLRWRDLYALNAGRLQPDGGRLTEATLLRVGWTLLLPADAADAVVVGPGQTLSGIAERELHDPRRAGELFALNRGRPQPDGRTLERPDLIRPGWTIALPDDDPTPPPQQETSDSATPLPSLTTTAPLPGPGPARPQPSPDAAPPSLAEPSATASPRPSGTPTVMPVPTAPSPSVPTRTGHPPSSTRSSANAAPNPSPSSGSAGADTAPITALLPIGAGASGLLVAGLLAGLAARRHRQLRHRLPRHRIAVPDDAAGRLEWHARTRLEPLDPAALDLALRGLALADWSGEEPPELATVALNRSEIRLSFEGTPDLPPPFVREPGDGDWLLPATAATDGEAASRCAPFPLLASVAHHDDTALLLDLEGLGVAHLTGEQEACVDLLRHLAADLANAPWSDDAEILLVGLGADLVPLNPDRLRAVPDLGAGLAEITAHVRRVETALADADVPSIVAGRLGGLAPDSWLPIVLLATGDATGTELDALLRLTERLGCGRRGVAVIVHGVTDAGQEIHLTDDGELLTPSAGANAWQAARLSRRLAAGFADILDATDTPDLPVGEAVGPTSWAQDMAEDGHPTVRGATPADTEAQRRLEITERQDPQLDDDLARWHRLGPPGVPLVGILGEPTVRAPGPPPRTRPSWFIEVLVYLCLHPAGVDIHKALTDLWPDGKKIDTATVRHAFYGARRWAGRGLADDPERAFLSDMQSDNTYRLRGHILDWDLFRRLRKRAQARHAAHHPTAIDDYRAALELVRGPVLSALRPGGYAWLNNHDQRHDLQIPGFVVDAAHELVEIALAGGDTTTARWAAETARSIDIDSIFDRPLTDLMRVATAEGRLSEMERYAAILLDARGFEVPEELPPETFAVLNELLPDGPRRRPAP